MGYVLRFEDCQLKDCESLGGKIASLVTLTAAGLPVPPGFAVSANAFRWTLAHAGLEPQLAELMSTMDPTDTDSISAAGWRARELILAASIPSGLFTSIVEAYADLCTLCGTDDVPVAVRSSATCEDQPDASFAGEHDTYLWVRGADDVLQGVRQCWASLYTDRAIAYRRVMGYTDAAAAMAVAVQKMVLPKTAGVAFTLNPLNGDRSQVAIDASWGFGEAVVSGAVTPDNFLVDKVIGEVHGRTISAKETEFRLTEHDHVEPMPIDPERRSVPSLTDDEVRAVAALARRAEKHYGCPQDVEWALDAQLPGPDNVLLLQSRPETVWSQKPKIPAARRGEDYLTSMVNTLVAPVTGRAGGTPG
ncbi:MAG: PEP/pyruvate-binding domain-containing protein [Actinomycetes bacterium]